MEGATDGNRWLQKKGTNSLKLVPLKLEQVYLCRKQRAKAERLLSYLYICSLACKIPRSGKKERKERGKGVGLGINPDFILFRTQGALYNEVKTLQ